MSLLVNHSIPLEERAKINCVCARPAFLYAVETWALTERLKGLLASCDHRMLTEIYVNSKMAGQDY